MPKRSVDNPNEFLKAVDDKNNALLKETQEGQLELKELKRWEVHKQGILHQSVIFFLLNQELALYNLPWLRICVTQRSTGKSFYPGYWSIAFGEHVKLGESSNQAVIRGLEEECGRGYIEPVFLEWYRKELDPKDREMCGVYYFVLEDERIELNSELSQAKFLNFYELPVFLGQERKLMPETEDLYHILKKHLGPV